MRLTTPEADFTLQTADDCQPVRLPNTKRSRPRKARDQDGKSTSCARVHSRLPPHPRAASRSGPRLHLHSTPASDALPGGPVGSQRLALFSSLCPPPPAYRRVLQHKLPAITAGAGCRQDPGGKLQLHRELGESLKRGFPPRVPELPLLWEAERWAAGDEGSPESMGPTYLRVGVQGVGELTGPVTGRRVPQDRVKRLGRCSPRASGQRHGQQQQRRQPQLGLDPKLSLRRRHLVRLCHSRSACCCFLFRVSPSSGPAPFPAPPASASDSASSSAPPRPAQAAASWPASGTGRA